MDLYAETILDHARSPRGKHSIPDPAVVHEEKNTSCGDKIRVELRMDGDRVAAIGWTGDGCAISQAAMSMLGETLAGKSTDDIAAMAPADILSLLGVDVGPRRLKCALLCLHTLQNTIHKLKQEPMQAWIETVGDAARKR